MKKSSRGQPKLEIIIPLYNEAAMVDLLIERLGGLFTPAALKARSIEGVHCHFIDDGSRDETAAKLCAHLARGFPGTLHRLSRNFGHQAAVSAGLDAAGADAVVVMDGDLQDTPELIFTMLEKWREGYDVVFAERKRRQEFFLKVFCYWLFYRILVFLADIDIPVDSGDFCLMDRKVVLALRRLPETLRFPRGLRAWVGFRQCGVAYERPRRQRGQTKYTVSRLYRLATDGIASMSIRVLQITQLFSFIFAFGSLALAAYATRLMFTPHPGQPMAIWFICGYLLNAASSFMLMFGIYIMSAYIGRTYLEVKHRPTYIVADTITGQDAKCDDAIEGV